MYIPSKLETGEKEGEFFKRVQAMVLARSEELDIIWKFIFGASLETIPKERLNLITNTSRNFSFGQHQMEESNEESRTGCLNIFGNSLNSSIVASDQDVSKDSLNYSTEIDSRFVANQTDSNCTHIENPEGLGSKHFPNRFYGDFSKKPKESKKEGILSTSSKKLKTVLQQHLQVISF